MSFFYLKALHIIAIVTWFSGLFYIVRLFIYHVEALEKEETEKRILTDQFKIMEHRLWYGITWPSAIAVGAFGLSMLHSYFPLTDHPWMIIKLSLVALLYLYHWKCGQILKELKNNNFKWSSNKLRLWNEVATLFLFAIVFLVVLQNIMSMAYGLLGLISLGVTLMIAIKIYRRKRELNER